MADAESRKRWASIRFDLLENKIQDLIDYQTIYPQTFNRMVSGKGTQIGGEQTWIAHIRDGVKDADMLEFYPEWCESTSHWIEYYVTSIGHLWCPITFNDYSEY